MTMQSDLVSGDNTSLSGTEKSFLFKAIANNGILLFLVLSYFAAANFISIAYATPIETISPRNLMWMLISIAPIFLSSMVLWRFGHMALNVRPAKPIHWLIKDLKTYLITDKERLSSGLIAAVSIIFFAAVFTFVKNAIPLLNPFSWDVTFADMDRALHGGYDPYVLLDPVFGNPFMTKLADTSYSVWFLLVYFFAFTSCVDKENPTRRNTFLIAFVLCWIIGGSVLATILSSVGPVYFEAFGFGEQFEPLMTSLEEIGRIVPLTALELQALLLDGYQSGGDLRGISAMPSMHLALSWLIAFQAFHYRKIFGWMMVAFAILIQFSSVHLGWHYAIDGYLGFVIAIVCWMIGMKLAALQAWLDKRSAG